VPLGPGGSRRYREALTDFSGRHVVDGHVLTAADDAILVADGAFLQRPELAPHWDLVVYLDVDFDEILRRGIARDQVWMGSAAEAEARYRSKYIPGERMYLEQLRPAQRAHVVVDNRDPHAPRLSMRTAG
jgi:uridine kinase